MENPTSEPFLDPLLQDLFAEHLLQAVSNETPMDIAIAHILLSANVTHTGQPDSPLPSTLLAFFNEEHPPYQDDMPDFLHTPEMTTEDESYPTQPQ